MAVSLVAKFSREQIARAMLQTKQRFEQVVLLNLQRIGEQFVKNARENANFTDRTGNLRSSIGYVILKDGEQISDNFKAVKNGPIGVSTAKQVIEQIKKDYKRGYVIIGIAGMDYAAAVESKGFDVITSSAKTAEVALKTAVQRLGNKLK